MFFGGPNDIHVKYFIHISKECIFTANKTRMQLTAVLLLSCWGPKSDGTKTWFWALPVIGGAC